MAIWHKLFCHVTFLRLFSAFARVTTTPEPGKKKLLGLPRCREKRRDNFTFFSKST